MQGSVEFRQVMSDVVLPQLAKFEPELVLMRRGSEQLARTLAPVIEEYEYVVVDCPPNLGYLTDNGLHATENVLIPALAESTSKRALELLYDHIEVLEGELGIEVTERGVVANRVEETNEAESMMDWFGTAFDDVPVWEVRKRVDLQRSFSAGVSVFEYKPEMDMADVFAAIAADLDRQYGFQEVKTRG
jgi:chromosome partitioning protein